MPYLRAVSRALLVIRYKHTSIGDLRDLGDVKQTCQDQNKDSDGKVNPLHVGQGRFVVEVVEKDIGTEHRGDDCADTVEGLRNVDANFRVSRRTTDYTCQ